MESTEADGQNTLEDVGVDEVDFGMKDISKGMKVVGKKTVEIGKCATDGAKKVIKYTEKRLGSMTESRYEMTLPHRGPVFIIEPLDECNEELIQSLKALEFFNIRNVSVNSIEKDLNAGLQGYDYSSLDCVMVIATIFPEQHFSLEGLLTKFRTFDYLEGKPKIFFVQVFDTQVNDSSSVLPLQSQNSVLPDDSVLFLSQIFVPDYDVLEALKSKCLLTNHLKDVLNQYGKSEELLHILLKLSRNLTEELESAQEYYYFRSEFVSFVCTASKKIYLFPRTPILNSKPDSTYQRV